MSDPVSEAEKYLDDVSYYGGPDPSTVPSVQIRLNDVLRHVAKEREQHAKLVAAAKELHTDFDSIWNSNRVPTRQQVYEWGRKIRTALEAEE